MPGQERKQENLANSAVGQTVHTIVAIYNAINIKVHLILRVVSALMSVKNND